MTLGRYAVALLLTVAAVLSQYVVPVLIPALRPFYQNLGSGLLIVYGIPIVAFAVLVGPAPLRRFATSMGNASIEGLRWYGLLSLLALFVGVVVVELLAAFDPAALHLLENQTNPEIAQASSDPWFWVAFAFVIGAFEETIFRGWIFGFWLVRGGTDWLLPAIGSSALFAGVHLYYATTYGVGAAAYYPTLFLLGFAFAGVYRYSGGNLVVVALLHGANDSVAFLVLISPWGAYAFHYGLVLVGAFVGLILYVQARAPPAPPPVAAWTGPDGTLPRAVPYDGNATSWPPPTPPPEPAAGAPPADPRVDPPRR
jgi:membrane protease YdiL (CAAX protease family)